jgi:hypothetical protein
MNRTIMERARSMRLHAGLPLQFWAEAVDTVVYLINRGPSGSLDGRILEEEWTGKKVMIQVDIGGHPPFPNGSKQFSGHFGNLLFLAGFRFRGHFEGLNEVFSRSRFSMIAKGMIEAPK